MRDIKTKKLREGGRKGRNIPEKTVRVWTIMGKNRHAPVKTPEMTPTEKKTAGMDEKQYEKDESVKESQAAKAEHVYPHNIKGGKDTPEKTIGNASPEKTGTDMNETRYGGSETEKSIPERLKEARRAKAGRAYLNNLIRKGKYISEKVIGTALPDDSGTGKNETQYAIDEIEKKTLGTLNEITSSGIKLRNRRARGIWHSREYASDNDKSSGKTCIRLRRSEEEEANDGECTGKKTEKSSVNGKGLKIRKAVNKTTAPENSQTEERQRFARLKKLIGKRQRKNRENRRKTLVKKEAELVLKAKTVKISIAVFAAAAAIAGLCAAIILICSGLIGGSPGILYSDELIEEGDLNIRDAIRAVNEDFQTVIEEEEISHGLENSVVEGDRATWREVLAVYAVKYSKDNKDEVFSVSDEKIDAIKCVFWDMNYYVLSSEMRDEDGQIPDDRQNYDELKETLVVTVGHKEPDEMAEVYSFTASEKKALKMLLGDDMKDMWTKLIYGAGLSGDLIETAASQLGQIGGEPYWSWWGYKSRVEWCAIFVSWCADQCGYIDDGIIPKFENCQAGTQWFKDRMCFEEGSTEPDSGWIIFFDWGGDGIADHVGIVEKAEDGTVYTIEGNSGDMCREKTYTVGSTVIYGYGKVKSE